MRCGYQFLRSRYWVLRAAVLGVFLAVEAAAQAAAPGSLSTEEIQRGKDLHELKCAKCHRLYDTADYDSETWDSWMVKMKKKAHLSDEESHLIHDYLESLRESKKA